MLTQVRTIRRLTSKLSESNDPVISREASRLKQFMQLGFRNGTVVAKREMTKALLASERMTPLLGLTSPSDDYSKFTVGFELETNATNGVTSNNIGEKVDTHNDSLKMDQPALDTAIAEKITAMQGGEGIHEVLNNNKFSKKFYIELLYTGWLTAAKKELKTIDKEASRKLFYDNLENNTVDVLKDMSMGSSVNLQEPEFISNVTTGDITKATASINKLAASRVDKSKYFLEPKLDSEQYRKYNILNIGTNTSLLPQIQVGTDTTVKGFEIRTVDSCSVAEFKSATKVVFGNGNKHVAGVGCSFHLHVGLPSIPIHYNETIQGLMTQYVIDNMLRLPAGVIKRFRTMPKPSDISDTAGERSTEDAVRFFWPQINTNKYSFIHYHRNFGTWEFRCFGNVVSEDGANVCLDIALEAVVYAYKAYDSKGEAAFSKTYFTKNMKQVSEAIHSSKPNKLSELMMGGIK